MRLARGRFGHDDKGDLSGLEALAALGTGEDAALGRKDARDPHKIACGDARGAQRELERGQLLAVFSDTFREEHLFGHESDHVTLLVARESAW